MICLAIMRNICLVTGGRTNGETEKLLFRFNPVYVINRIKRKLTQQTNPSPNTIA